LSEAAADDMVFADEHGNAYHPQRIRVLFARASDTAGLPKIRLHDLRHTMATTALAAGIHPKVVQERLGHTTVSMTLDTYSHVTDTIQTAGAEKLHRAMNPKINLSRSNTLDPPIGESLEETPEALQVEAKPLRRPAVARSRATTKDRAFAEAINNA
jgi:hypothetical protein